MKHYLRGKPILFSLLRVTSANIISLIIGMFTSLLMPLVLSNTNYGYWQLFSLYSAYPGFFILGFNDGVYLNYVGEKYDAHIFGKFRTFRNIDILLSFIGALITSIIAIVFFTNQKRFILIMLAIYTLTVGVTGLCTYTNQVTLRFKEYSRSVIIERVVFSVLVVCLVIFKVNDYRMFIIASLVSSYSKVMYNYCVNKDIMLGKGVGFDSISSEIKNNFKKGFVLMVSLVLNGSIIVGGRLILEKYFGIEAFGGFSFALNANLIANQIILSFSQVFYPILKSINSEKLESTMMTLQNAISIFATILLVSYFVVYLLVAVLYVKYSSILEYLMYLYPLFIFQSKYSLVILNTQKIDKNMKALIFNNLFGIILNFLLCYMSYVVFRNVKSIAIATLIGYLIWYYYCLVKEYKMKKWVITSSIFNDIAILFVFIISIIIPRYIITTKTIWVELLAELSLYSFFVLALLIYNRKKVKSTFADVREFLKN